VLYPIYDGLYLLVFLLICIMQLPPLSLTPSQKLTVSYIAIATCMLLALLLTVHNIAMNVIEGARFFCGVDYLSKYYETEYVETSEEYMEQSEHPQTNVPLIKEDVE
jgi:hypothetical protein